jgi:anti-sigma factor RsiW
MEQCDLQLLSAYFDGELPKEQRLQVEAHLKDCPACRAELDALSAAMKRITVDQLTMLDEREAQEIYLRIEQSIGEAADEPRLFRLGMVVSALAASVLISCIAWINEMPAARENAASSVASVPDDWERVAVTLLPDAPADLTENPSDEKIRLANAEPFANWMVKALERE